MNAYSPSSNKAVTISLLTISIVLTGVMNSVLNAVNLEFQWLISAVSVVGIYRILYFTFDRFIWRWSLLRNLGLIIIPDLNGRWKGHIMSSYHLNNQNYPISVVITQQWSKILVRLETEKSDSKSIAASFLTDDPTSPELIYVYDNDPINMAPESMHAHSGTAKLRLTGSTLRGKYYTGRGRETTGDIVLERSKDA